VRSRRGGPRTTLQIRSPRSPRAAEQRIAAMAMRMRRGILNVCQACNVSAHLGGRHSIVEIMAAPYGAVLRYDPSDPAWAERDRFILSKRHGALRYYSAL